MRSLTLVTLVFVFLTSPLFSGCKGCKQLDVQPDPTHEILILASFSMPETSWISLSKDMEGKNAAFVVRGLPGNSFKKFAARIASLKEKGMSAPVLVDPIVFLEHQVEMVPTFLFFKPEEVHQVKGNITLRSAEEIVGGTR